MADSYIVVDDYIPSKRTVVDIDNALAKHHLFRDVAFWYNVGDCLFDTFAVLLHFRYSSIELRSGIIDHFLHCFHRGDADALKSFQLELDHNTLYTLHRVPDVETYFRLMKLPVTASPAGSETGLWDDSFCINWLSKWLNIPIWVWSKTTRANYFQFNAQIYMLSYCVLFDDANPCCGHYEPLYWKKVFAYIHSIERDPLAGHCSAFEIDWDNIHCRLERVGLRELAPGFTDCGESLFGSICQLCNGEFDIQCLRRYVAQSFCNAFLSQKTNALSSLSDYLDVDIISSILHIANWQGFIINMALPYKRGRIEGNPFCLQWLAIILNIRIQVWNSQTMNIGRLYSGFQQPLVTYNLISFVSCANHVHYKALRQTSLTISIVDDSHMQKKMAMMPPNSSLRKIKRSMRSTETSAKEKQQTTICSPCTETSNEFSVQHGHMHKRLRVSLTCTKHVIRHSANNKSKSDLHVKKFKKQICDTSIHICPICKQLQFKYNTRMFRQSEKEAYFNLTKDDTMQQQKKTCRACYRCLKKGALPKLASPACIDLNLMVLRIAILTDLEERLVAMRIAFAQIRHCTHRKPQFTLKGAIINVPSDVDIIQRALPRRIDETKTIDVELKRRLEYKDAYLLGNVRPHVIIKALKQLCKTTLYRMEKVRLNREWIQFFPAILNDNEDHEILLSPDALDGDNDDDNVGDTLVHGFVDAKCIHDLQDKLIQIAPAEGKRPLGICEDKYSEEMNFPTLFFGEPCSENVAKTMSYLKIAQWEVQHSDQSFAYHVTNLFFKTMKIIIGQVRTCMWVRIRKGKLKGRKLLARDAKYRPNLEKILKSDIGYIDFKKIRISPDYMQQLKKNVFAMIRQLGPPTFFLTFSSAEHCWKHLSAGLSDLYQHHIQSTSTRKPPPKNTHDKNFLVKNDPITCTRYYKHRLNALQNLLCKEKSFFGDIIDFFRVTEFQNRGNAHSHWFIWTKDAPVYGKNPNSSIVAFVNTYITCNTESFSLKIEKLHQHHHTESCKKGKKSKCKYSFPQPPMRATQILEPPEASDSLAVTNAKHIYSILANKQYDRSFSFCMFLEELNIDETDYIKAIQSTIKQPTLFFKRKPSQAWNNTFSKQIPAIWKANTDAQFVLNAYAAATYISSYMTKIDNSTTKAFKRIREEHQKSHIDVVQMIQRLANEILNSQQMSAQQAAHIVLSIPLNSSSRKCIFINTSSSEDRTFILKRPSLLNQEPDQSENIMRRSIIDHYIARLESIAHICLAEFVSRYDRNGKQNCKQGKQHIIRFVNYNRHIDKENNCREKLLLYVPFQNTEDVLKHGLSTWQGAYVLHHETITQNEANFVYNISAKWGDLKAVLQEIKNDAKAVVASSFEQKNPLHQMYDIHADLPFHTPITLKKRTSLFQIAKHPLLLDNIKYYNHMRMLNKKQQEIVKDIALKKHIDPATPIYLFLTGGAGTGKTFTAKMIFETLLRIYNNSIDGDPVKPKGLVLAFTGKVAYNAGGTTFHSAFLLPFNKSQIIPLTAE